MKRIFKLIKKIIGIILIIAGIIGIFLPFLQGVLMILLGLVLLGNPKLEKFVTELIKKIKKKCIIIKTNNL